MYHKATGCQDAAALRRLWYLPAAAERAWCSSLITVGKKKRSPPGAGISS